MSHPPFAHNPHVYNGIDPDGNPTTGLVVHSDVEPVEDAAPVGQSDEDANTDVDGDGQVTGYEVFTKADLVAECEQRGLPTSGNKPDLVARLQEADKAAADTPPESTE